MRVLFRVDSGGVFGVGHLFRCRNLAKIMINKGWEVTFLTKEHSTNKIYLIDKEFKVIKIKSKIKFQNVIDDDYSTWNCESDADEFIRVNSYANDYDILIVDHYGIGYEFDDKINQIDDLFYVVIDDLKRKHICNLLLDQNYSVTSEDYSSSLSDVLLLGQKFTLLNENFLKLDRNKNREHGLKQIGVFFGGGDNTIQALNVLKAFQDYKKSFSLNIILNKNNEFYRDVEEYANTTDSVTLADFHEDFPAYLNSLSYFFGASGASNWERMFLGLPSFLVTVADNQVETTEKLHNDGLIIYLGHNDEVGVSHWKNAFEKILRDQESIEKLGKKGEKLIDGFGSLRVFEKIEESYEISRN